MTRRRQLVPVVLCADADGLLAVLRDNLGRADAFITAAEELIDRPGGGIGDGDADDDADASRRRNHLAHLIASAKLAIRAAAFATQELEQHGQGA
jgi:hypothetical protein